MKSAMSKRLLTYQRILAFIVIGFALTSGLLLSFSTSYAQSVDRKKPPLRQIKTVPLSEYLVSRGARGNILREVLESVGLREKVNHELFEYLDIDLNETVAGDESRLIRESWEDSNLLWLVTDTDDVLKQYAFDMRTGHLERALTILSPDMNLPDGLTGEELKKLLISKEEALSIIKKVVSLAGFDFEIKPEKLEFNPHIYIWHYSDFPEYYGIRSQSKIGIGVYALTGKVRTFSAYNLYLPSPTETKATITDKMAADIASAWGENNGFIVRPETISLTYAPGSNIWSGQRDAAPYVVEDKFRLCWSVALRSAEHPEHFSDGVILFIDALTGEISGGMDTRV